MSADATGRMFSALFADAADAFWLDSSRPDPSLGRLSILGAATGPHGWTHVHGPPGARHRAPDFYPELRRLLAASQRPVFSDDVGRAAPALPGGFSPGLICALGYELGMDGRGAGTHAAHSRPRPALYPDAVLIAPSHLVVLDHFTGEVVLLAAGHRAAGHLAAGRGEADPDPEALRWLDDAEKLINRALPIPELTQDGHAAWDEPAVREDDAAEFVLDASRDEYLESIALCQDAIGRGEAYEICLTNTASGPGLADPLGAYRQLRRHTPAPFGAFLRFGGTAMLGASPERFLRVGADGAMETRPIKGTRPRGADAASDRALREDLARNGKDRAENLMIVDLLRNDLGQVSELGSVHVPQLCEVETFSHVHQLVSTITGTLAPGCDLVDAIAATFPGGSMTGAPKRRATDLCAQIERRPRGLYSGAVGWLSPDGSADLAITIRTAVTTAEATTIGVGGAVLAPSDPAAEWDETLVKLGPVLDALGARLGPRLGADRG